MTIARVEFVTLSTRPEIDGPTNFIKAIIGDAFTVAVTGTVTDEENRPIAPAFAEDRSTLAEYFVRVTAIEGSVVFLVGDDEAEASGTNGLCVAQNCSVLFPVNPGDVISFIEVGGA